MNTLTIGSWVRVRVLSSLYYDEHGTRTVGRTDCKPFDGQITGQVIKPLGHYIEGRPGSWAGRFKPTGGSVTFWLVRAGLVNKEALVGLDDVEPVAPRPLPRLAPRPEIIWPADTLDVTFAWPELAVLVATLVTTW